MLRMESSDEEGRAMPDLEATFPVHGTKIERDVALHGDHQ